MDVADILQFGFKDLYKKKGVNLRLSAVRKEQNNHRRDTRNAIMTSKRHIRNLSPYVTPCRSNQTAITEKPAAEAKLNEKTAKRYEQLLKWKQEKERKAQEQKCKTKPIFKITHVPVKVGLPDLENVNKLIKGKLINTKLATKSNKYNFAPPNHQFRAPANIRPVRGTPKVKEQLDTILNDFKRMTRSQKPVVSPVPDLPVRRRKLNLNKHRDLKAAPQPVKEKKVVDTPIGGKISQLRQRDGAVIHDSNSLRKIAPSSAQLIGKSNGMATRSNGMSTKSNGMATKSNVTASKDKGATTRTRSEAKKVVLDVSSELEKTPKIFKKTPAKLKGKSKARDRLSTKRGSELNFNVDEDQDSRNVQEKLEKDVVSSGSPPESVDLQDAAIDCGLNCTLPQRRKSCSVKYSTPSTKQVPVVYISPFVTISRGKSNAKKEYLSRLSKGGSYDSSPDIERNTGKKAGAAYFNRVLEQEISRIEEMCAKWMLYKDEQNPPEEAVDMINVAIGQSQLLLSKKFKQFQNLIDSCINDTSDMCITCQDLHGYWETAYIQVENLDKRFANLENLRTNNWEEILPEVTKRQTKTKAASQKPKVQASSSIRDAIRAAREKARSRKTKGLPTGEALLIAVAENQSGDDVKTFDGKFFTVRSPRKSVTKTASPKSAVKTPRHSRKSLLTTVLSNQAKKRNSSPGLTMIRASRIGRSFGGTEESKLTPRSILKSQANTSIKRPKSVLFKEGDFEENIDDKETVNLKADANVTSEKMSNFEETSNRSKPEDFLKTPHSSLILQNITNSGSAKRRSSRLSRNRLF